MVLRVSHLQGALPEQVFSNKLKVFRRVATRYDKLIVSFLDFVHLAFIWILLKWYKGDAFSDAL